MWDILESLLGGTGALVAQSAIAIIVAVVLIAVVYWLVKRLSGMRLGGIGRGRVPRLAIVDAMAVDSRRRLVLVRRDNVEHLIMIGGPSDLVVEPSIVRARPRAPQQPVRRGQQAPVGVQPAPAPPIAAPPAPGNPDAPPGYPPVLVPLTRDFAPARAETDATAEPNIARPDGETGEKRDHPTPEPVKTAGAPDDSIGPEPDQSPKRDAGEAPAGDLEQDMAKLLGEIDTKRSSI